MSHQDPDTADQPLGAEAGVTDRGPSPRAEILRRISEARVSRQPTSIQGQPGPSSFELLVYESDAAFCERLAALHPELSRRFAEHVHDHAEVLAHIFMADVERWFEETYRAGQRDALLTLTRWLDEEYPQASPSIENVIVVSFLEMLPWPPDPEAEPLAQMLGPRLRRTLREMQAWRPPSTSA